MQVTPHAYSKPKDTQQFLLWSHQVTPTLDKALFSDLMNNSIIDIFTLYIS